MKSTLSRTQLKLLLDGKSLSCGRSRFTISNKESDLYKEVKELYNNKYQTKKIILDTDKLGIKIDYNFRMDWEQINSEEHPDYKGHYKFADKDCICFLHYFGRFEDKEKYHFTIMNSKNNKEYLICGLVEPESSAACTILESAEYNLIEYLFHKADAIGVTVNTLLMKDDTFYEYRLGGPQNEEN